MRAHVCPWWGGYFIDNPLRRWLHNPQRLLSPFVRPGFTCLDFGCGMGIFTIAMARLVGDPGRVIAADLQPRMLSVLARRAAKAGVGHRVQTHRCAADSLGLSVTVDFALAFYSLHEVPDPQRLLNEIHAGLQDGGNLLVVEPKGHVIAKDFDRMLAMARQAGFREDQRPSVRLSRAAVLAKR